MHGQSRAEPVERDTRRWNATRGSISVAARSELCPLVVTVTPANAGAFLDDGSSIRRQIAAISPLVARSVAMHRRRRRAQQIVLLAPSAWLRLPWPGAAVGDRAAQVALLAGQLDALLAESLVALPVDAVVLGAHFAGGSGQLQQDFDGVFVFDGDRRAFVWGGAQLLHTAAASATRAPIGGERDLIADVPGLGACLVLNDHEIAALMRAGAPGVDSLVAQTRARGVRHVLHLAYGAGPDGMWAARLARLEELVPGLSGWASTSRTTPGERRRNWYGLVRGFDHLPLTVTLADEG